MKIAAKIVTTKEFQRNSAAIFRAVKAGQPYQVTFHRKPVVNLTPAVKPKPATKPPRRGSHEAFLESLEHTVQATGDLYNLSYKELRARMIEEKHGK
jgi:antitoxin (DNA-binding transcriptional repressor) of toxin-antitoxin stability system